MMTRTLTVICALFFVATVSVRADTSNPAFNGKSHQLSVHPGISLRDGFEELFIFGLTYSQPNYIFRLHGRRNVEFITQYGLGEYSRYNQELIFGLSQDAMIPFLNRMYGGVNLGIYIKSRKTDRIDSKFTFGQRVFLGCRISDRISLELYARHFSNGSLTEMNDGQNFAGVSAMWNF